MPLSKLLERGERITAVVHQLGGDEIVRARVRGTIRGVVSFRVVDHFGPRGGSVKRRDEGRTWLRGWEGLDVEALRATFLLVRSAS